MRSSQLLASVEHQNALSNSYFGALRRFGRRRSVQPCEVVTCMCFVGWSSFKALQAVERGFCEYVRNCCCPGGYRYCQVAVRKRSGLAHAVGDIGIRRIHREEYVV
ncbi:hypothetical protein JG687_00019723 [Phytophthora cactorum]|uniref:Uncharacterized protein n=1 Tax=Phytophthora cactorum TaxID=29920 RepID=A0A8T1TKH7_9STRA|nr:hypothetical protein JG687_00019723 [Phytophthora cactorum]